eukprot:1922073-Prymnesium_polylepis.1
MSEFGRKPFRGLLGEDRTSGQYRGGDTRVRIVDPGHLTAQGCSRRGAGGSAGPKGVSAPTQRCEAQAIGGRGGYCPPLIRHSL